MTFISGATTTDKESVNEASELLDGLDDVFSDDLF